MAKISKSMLKDIVKECLVEILAEGIGSAPPGRLKNKKRRTSNPPRVSEGEARRKVLDNITFKKNAKEAVQTLTDDPLMSSIFADTAMGSLQEQIAASPSQNMGLLAPQDQGPDVMDVFGESAQNWATLAFGEKKVK